jgi:transposase-like protein
MTKKPHKISAEVKADILKRVKQDGVPVAQAASDAGIHETTVYGWLTKGVSGTPSWSEFGRLQRQNRELLELVGELTLRLSASQKKI